MYTTSKIMIKKIDKVKAIVISQINLCRFIYKLIGFIKGNI